MVAINTLGVMKRVTIIITMKEGGWLPQISKTMVIKIKVLEIVFIKFNFYGKYNYYDNSNDCPLP